MGPDTRTQAARDMDTGEMVPATPDVPDMESGDTPVAPRAVPIAPDNAVP